MSTTSWESSLDPPSDFELEEWLLFIDNEKEKQVNDPLLKFEVTEQILQEIEDPWQKENDCWSEEFPLFEEIQSVASCEETLPQVGPTLQDLALKLDYGQLSKINQNPAISEFSNITPTDQELYDPSHEDSMITLSNENIFYIDTESFIKVEPFKSACLQPLKDSANNNSLKKSDDNIFPNISFQPEKTTATIDLEEKERLTSIDEILQNTAMDLDPWESETSRSESSSDGFVAQDSSSSAQESDDPEWRPEPVKSSEGGRSYTKKSRSYHLEDKRLRKKEQNKNAAIRYRQKKKAQVSEILKEEEQLKEKKTKLEEKVFEIQNEIKYLKGLMRDLYRAKGLIN